MKQELNNKQKQWLEEIKEVIEKYDYNPSNKKINKILGGNKKLEKTIHREMRSKQ